MPISKMQTTYSMTLLALLCTLLVGCGGGDTDPATDEAEDAEVQAEGPDAELPPAPSSALEAGRAVFVEVCARCHIESEYAPTVGDTRAWQRRYARADDGVQTLYDHAINGFRDMEAKGGRRGAHLSDDQVRAAVDYAVAITGAQEPLAVD